MTTITAVKPQSLDGLSYIKVFLGNDNKISQTQNHTACWDMVVSETRQITMPVLTKQGNISRVYRETRNATTNNRRSDTAELTPQAANDLVKLVGENKKHRIERDPLNDSILIIRIL